MNDLDKFTLLGSTLSNDPLADKRFVFPFVNPPYGDEWSKDYDAVTAAHHAQRHRPHEKAHAACL